MKCDGATCALVCENGTVVNGPKRIRCRQKANGNYHWRKNLGICVSCEPPEIEGLIKILNLMSHL